MHPLIEQAKSAIRTWSTDEPRELSLAVAAMCRGVLDATSLSAERAGWQQLRRSFDIEPGQEIAATIVQWDHHLRFGDFGETEGDAYVQLGIVTWTVKLLLKKLGMLTGPKQELELEEWKARLIENLDKYILSQ